MKMLAAGLGAGVGLFLAATSAPSQTLPHAGADAIDQTMSDSTLLPATGLTLDAPSGLGQPGGDAGNQSRPSDGLGLRIYESGTRGTAPDNDGERESPGVAAPSPNP